MRGDSLISLQQTLTAHLLVLVFGAPDEEKPKKALTSKYPLSGKGRVRQGKEGAHRKTETDRQAEVCLDKKIVKIMIYYKGLKSAVLRVGDANPVFHLFL